VCTYIYETRLILPPRAHREEAGRTDWGVEVWGVVLLGNPRAGTGAEHGTGQGHDLERSANTRQDFRSDGPRSLLT